MIVRLLELFARLIEAMAAALDVLLGVDAPHVYECSDDSMLCEECGCGKARHELVRGECPIQ